jgi:cytochrome c-type biogenesis protein CcmF
MLLASAPASIGAALGFAAAVWVGLGVLRSVWVRVRHREDKLRTLARLPRGFIGMTLAHLGLGVFVVGVTAVTTYDIERDVRLTPGASETLAGHRFTLLGVDEVQGPNYRAQRGIVQIERDGRTVATLHPEKRLYASQSQPMTEAAIDPGLTRDLYVALGEPLGQGAWSVRLYYKPFIRWIWLGALMMALGGLLAATDRRYRMAMPARRETVEAAA